MPHAMAVTYPAPLPPSYGPLAKGRCCSSSPRSALLSNDFLSHLRVRPRAWKWRTGASAHVKKVLGRLPDPSLAVVTESSWAELILNSEIPVLVEFWASWCGPCRMVRRVVDEIAREYAGRIKCFQLDTDNDPQIAVCYEVHSIPTVVVFKNGEKQEAMTGTMPKSIYVAAIERSLCP